MVVRFSKSRNGAVLTCIRPDGSQTWSRLRDPFAYHDLLHYAVEATLEICDGFFGLIAAGRSIDSFSAPAAGGALPPVAGQVEFVVGLIQAELADGRRDEDFCKTLTRACSNAGVAPLPGLTSAGLDAIHELAARLIERWQTLPNGGHMDLEFPAFAAEARRRPRSV